jgi:hypothetical protein
MFPEVQRRIKGGSKEDQRRIKGASKEDQRGFKGNQRKLRGRIEYFLECSKKFWNILKKVGEVWQKKFGGLFQKVLWIGKVFGNRKVLLKVCGGWKKVWMSPAESCEESTARSGACGGGQKWVFPKFLARFARLFIRDRANSTTYKVAWVW